MNKFLTNNISLILKVYLYFQVLIDLLTGIMINHFHVNVTIGIIIRGLFLLLILYYYIFVNKNTTRAKFFYLLGVILFSIIFIIVTIVSKDISVLYFESSQLFKIFYFAILLTIIDSKDIDIDLEDFVNIAILYLVLIFVPNVFNISYNSYTQGNVGSVGLFNSGNEISAILSILNPILVYYIFHNKNKLKKILLSLLMAVTYFKIGSKIIIISLIISIIFNLIMYFKNNKDRGKKYIILIVIVILLLLGIFLLPKTNFYYNIILHLNYLGINNIIDVFSYNFINRFIFSDRLMFLITNFNNYINSGFFGILFGVGFIHNYATDIVSTKLVEMDLFDILFSLGIIGFSLYMMPLLNSIKVVFEKKKNVLIKFSILMALVISVLVGHTLVAPSVSLLIVFIFKYRNKIK